MNVSPGMIPPPPGSVLDDWVTNEELDCIGWVSLTDFPAPAPEPDTAFDAVQTLTSDAEI